jgi:hypothetical protein
MTIHDCMSTFISSLLCRFVSFRFNVRHHLYTYFSHMRRTTEEERCFVMTNENELKLKLSIYDN